MVVVAVEIWFARTGLLRDSRGMGSRSREAACEPAWQAARGDAEALSELVGLTTQAIIASMSALVGLTTHACLLFHDHGHRFAGPNGQDRQGGALF